MKLIGLIVTDFIRKVKEKSVEASLISSISVQKMSLNIVNLKSKLLDIFSS